MGPLNSKSVTAGESETFFSAWRYQGFCLISTPAVRNRWRFYPLFLQGGKRPIQPWNIVGAGCLWGRLQPPQPLPPTSVSPPKWQRKGVRGHGNELCSSPARRVKRGNFWNDGCRRWCPMCFSSLEFKASAALRKQLGSKTGHPAISSSPFHFFFPPPTDSLFFIFIFFFLCEARSAVSLRENTVLDFSWGTRRRFACCLDANIAVFTRASITGDRAELRN